MMTNNDQALAWMDVQEPGQLYDPESLTFDELHDVLEKVYLYCYPWHNTHEAKSYDYPTFDQAVRDWAKDDLRQSFTAKVYCETLDWLGANHYGN